MSDPTESIRRKLMAEINAEPGSRERLEAEHGQVWDTTQLQQEFQVLGFSAPFVVVRRRSDGQMGSLLFQHSPRLYYDFQAQAPNLEGRSGGPGDPGSGRPYRPGIDDGQPGARSPSSGLMCLRRRGVFP